MQPFGESAMGAIVPVESPNWQGWLKAAALLIQNGLGTGSLPTVFSLIPSFGLWPLTRTSLQLVPEVVLLGHPKLRGCPPCSVTIQFVAQPPRTALAIPPRFIYRLSLPNGSSYP